MVPTVTRLHPASNAAAVSTTHPRGHNDSALTIGDIVSSAGPLAGQARTDDSRYPTDD
jgi:hypothetical protein